MDKITSSQITEMGQELQTILFTSLPKNIVKKQLSFADELYQQVFRLWKIPYTAENVRNKSDFIKRLTIDYIYKPLSFKNSSSIDKSLEKHCTVHFDNKLFQISIEELKTRITELKTLASISKTKEDFEKHFEVKYGTRILLDDTMEEKEEATTDDFDKSMKKIMNFIVD